MFPELWTIPLFDYPIRSYGFMLMIGFFSATYLAAKRAEKVRANPDVVLSCAFFALIGGLLGARLFYVAHYWEQQFANAEQPLSAVFNVREGGMEQFGGIAGAIVFLLGYLTIKRQPVRLYLDILTPGLLWGIAFGRIGCFLFGCCWGGVCDNSVAQNWAVRFPFGSPAHIKHYQDRFVKVPAELLQASPLGEYAPLPREHVFLDPAQRGKYAHLLATTKKQYEFAARLDPESDETKAAEREMGRYEALAQTEATEYAAINQNLNAYWSEEYPGQKITPSELAARAVQTSLPVHPAQLYAALNALLGSLFLSWVFRCRRRHGMVFAVWLLTYPPTRLILEQIRIDNPADTFGLTISSALSLGMIAIGAVLVVWFYRLPTPVMSSDEVKREA